MLGMVGTPQRTEAAPYYFTYIDRIPNPDVVSVLESQLDPALDFLHSISKEKSLSRYAPGKWTIRQVMGHINDTERMFVFRAMWFARGFETPLPSFDQDIAVAGAQSDAISWARHMQEFREVRRATLSFFRNLSPEAWARTGTASGNPFTVRALAYIAAGHLDHHMAIVRERYITR